MSPLPDIGKPPELAWLPTEKLDVDPSYQRTLETRASQKMIERIADNFSWMRFQAILAIPGKPGRWLIIDGQHRAAAARIRKIAHLPAVVIAEANQAEQAAAFVGANKDRVPVSAQALFHARLLAGDPAAATLQRLCDRAGVKLLRYNLAMSRTPAGHTPAVSRLLQLLRIHGEERLGRTLCVVADVFGEIPGAFRSIVFEASARFLADVSGETGLALALQRLGPDKIENIAFGITTNSAIPLIVQAMRAAIGERPPTPAPPPRPPAPTGKPLAAPKAAAPAKGGGFQDDPRARADHGSRDPLNREAVFGRSVTGSSL